MKTPLGLFAAIALAGCGSDNTSFIIVTVDGPAAVHGVASLHVTLTNDSSDRSDDLAFGSNTFPVTFSLDAPGRTGELDIAIDALDAGGTIVGHGTASSTLETPTAMVHLDSTDFVINTDFAGDQFLSLDFEASGNQLAAIADGTWTAAFRDSCLPTSGCNMFGRRFDPSGAPVSSVIAAGTGPFALTTNLTLSNSTPAVSSSATTTIAVWDFDDPVLLTQGISCRSLDAAGSPAGDEVIVSTDPSTDVVSATPLANGNFALTWNASVTNESVRGAIVKPDCTIAFPPSTIGTSATGFAHRAAVTSNASAILYAWIDSGAVHTRVTSLTNSPTTADTVVLPMGTTEEVEHVRLLPFGNAFGVVVRWEPLSGTGEGRIELYKASTTGALVGTPILVTNKSGGDAFSVEAFGVAAAADGSVMVVWSACDANGDGSGCGVFGQLVGADQMLKGGPISLATTTLGDQTDPSVVALPNNVWVAAWADSSAAPPDVSGRAARARIIYP